MGFQCTKPVYSALVGVGSRDPYHKAFNGFFSLYLKAPTHTEDMFLGSRTLPQITCRPFHHLNFKAWCALSWQRGPVQLATKLLQFQFRGASPKFWDSTLGATTLEAMTLKLRCDPGEQAFVPSLVHNPWHVQRTWVHLSKKGWLKNVFLF
jgi:hypothetical protein